MKRLVSALVFIVFAVPFLMLYLLPSEKKPHFADRSNRRPQLVELAKLQQGQKEPKFEKPSKARNKTRILQKDKERNEKQLQRHLREEDKIMGLAHLDDMDTSKRKILQ